MAKSKKFLRRTFTTAVAPILEDISRCILCSEICEHVGIIKQDLYYWLNELLKVGLIERKARGIYRITESGKRVLEEYKLQKRKKLLAIEQMKYRFPIIEGATNLIKSHNWKKSQQMNNTTFYNGSFNGHTLRLFDGSKNPSMEIHCGQFYGSDFHEMMFDAKLKAIEIARMIEKKYQVKFGDPIKEMDPEFVIPHPLSDALLTKTGASQWRTPRGTFNRSKGRDADIEVRSPHLAEKILDMPYIMERVEERVIGLEVSMSKVISEVQNLSAIMSTLASKFRASP